MFKNLTKKFSKIINSIRKKTFLSKSDILEKLREIRLILLESDVSLQVVREFIEKVKKKSIKQKKNKFLNFNEFLINIVQKELSYIIGSRFNKFETKLNFNGLLPNIILLVGLQGCGKTTTVGKLSRYLKINFKKKILNVSVDLYRPAASIQLEILSKQANVDFFKNISTTPINIIAEAIAYSKKHKYDLLIIDTAGRLIIDKFMMEEIKNIYEFSKPIETLLIIDAMLGQDSVNIANIFSTYITFTGIILTKLDSDTKGGVALSVTQTLKKPIKFIGNSEKIEGLEIFNPDLMSKRILGINKILFTKNKTKTKNKKKKIIDYKKEIQNFNFNSFKSYILKVKKINLFSNLFFKLMGVLKIKNNKINIKEILKHIKTNEVIINSMTLKERKFPRLIGFSQIIRIAKGAGVSTQNVNNLLSQYNNLKLVMNKYIDYDINKIINDVKNMFNIK
ncbi:signal recognition particle receptor subunit alpha [Candidatus Zinderia endosymbiont of Aphrophora alni]|uniref:signal recognition particle receptor subunit alpha n=1 Tax=Candidatus Zinderia endosymbiont of Aphrophora alni TaxID=3077951 RepID=UPI0030D150AA